MEEQAPPPMTAPDNPVLTEQEPAQPDQGLLGKLSIAAVVLASVWIVWALNSRLRWPAKVCHVLAASTVAWLIPGLHGIAMINALTTLAFYTMPVEGAILGGKRYGWPGAVAGFLVGLVLSPLTALIATALTTAAVMTLERLGRR